MKKYKPSSMKKSASKKGSGMYNTIMDKPKTVDVKKPATSSSHGRRMRSQPANKMHRAKPVSNKEHFKPDY